MTHQPYAIPLVFSGYYGDNILLSDNGLLAEGQYLTAHGQFITHGLLRHSQQFVLEFRGTGIVKLGMIQGRRQAVEWVLSKQPLPKGCKRLKMKGLARYKVAASDLNNCVRMESQMRTKTKAFIFGNGPEATLAFDIECGDLLVSIFNTSSNVTFDTCYRSPHIEITTTQRMSSACLHHYNPSALCSLDNAPLQPGAIFQLEVRHSGPSKDSGSYIRVCVSRKRNLYVNNEHIACCASPDLPAYTGKRMCLEGGNSEMLRVTVVSGGLILNRDNRVGVEKLTCPITAELTLWFELHKASLRAWRLSDCHFHNPADDLRGYAPTNDMGVYVPANAMRGYAPTNDLRGYVPTNDMGGYVLANDMRGYAPTNDLKGYAPTNDLRGYVPTNYMGGYAPANDLRGYVPTNGASFPRQPAPPPVCRPRTGKSPMVAHAGYTEGAPCDACSDAGYTEGAPSDETKSVVSEMDVPLFTNKFASYVSPDSLCALRDGEEDPTCAPNTRAAGIVQCDLLCDIQVDSTALNSIEPDLVTMSSLESYADSRVGEHKSPQPRNINPAGKDPIYEKPSRLWLQNKNVHGKSDGELAFNINNAENVSYPKEGKKHLELLSQTQQTTILTSIKPERSPQQHKQHANTGYSESGDDMVIGNYVLKFNATARRESYIEDSWLGVRNERMDVLSGRKATQRNERKHDSPGFSQPSQRKPSASVHALRGSKINRYVGNTSPGSVETNHAVFEYTAHKYNVPPRLPIDDSALLNIGDAEMDSSEAGNRRLIRDKVHCQQFPNNYRRRCIYMSKKPELPPRNTSGNCFSEANVANINSHTKESQAKVAISPVTPEQRLDVKKSHFHKSNSSTSGKHDISHILASLKIRAPLVKTRSASNASDHAKKTTIKHSKSFSFLRLHHKEKTQCVNELPRPLTPQ